MRGYLHILLMMYISRLSLALDNLSHCKHEVVPSGDEAPKNYK